MKTSALEHSFHRPLVISVFLRQQAIQRSKVTSQAIRSKTDLQTTIQYLTSYMFTLEKKWNQFDLERKR